MPKPEANLKALIFFFALFFSLFSLKAQDTVKIFFPFGSSEIPAEQLSILYSSLENYEAWEIDSIRLIGYTDSIGKVQANLKLAEKRSRAVSGLIIKKLPGNMDIHTIAAGEKSKQVEEADRRVDVVIYGAYAAAGAKPAGPKKAEINVCYLPDYEMLNAANVKILSLKGKKYTQVTLSYCHSPMKDYYYGTENDSGGFTAVKINWKSRMTGKKWWTAKRLLTVIPEEDYEKYKIFTLEKKPCSACGEDYPSAKKITKAYSCIKTDAFLTSNMQIRPRFLNRKEVKVRVPAEFVDLNSTYYYDYSEANVIAWEAKKGKRKKLYYYTRLPLHLYRYTESYTRKYYTDGISRKMTCCTEGDTTRLRNRIDCGGSFSFETPCFIGLESGVYYQKKSLYHYSALGIYREWEHWQANLSAGINEDVKLWLSMRAQYNFFTIPAKMLVPSPAWRSSSSTFNSPVYFRLYAGAELQRLPTNEGFSLFGQYIHAGISLAKPEEEDMIVPEFKRIFIQYGLSYNYYTDHPGKIYPLLQAGLILKFSGSRLLSFRPKGSRWL